MGCGAGRRICEHVRRGVLKATYHLPTLTAAPVSDAGAFFAPGAADVGQAAAVGVAAVAGRAPSAHSSSR
jgi:hypothetical protein